MPRAARPMPDDFAEMRAKHSLAYLIKHYQCGNRAIQRWNVSLNGPSKRKTRIPVPDNFLAIAPRLTKLGMGREWNVSNTVIDRWLKETGVKLFVRGYNKDLRTVKAAPARTLTEFDLAADKLRKRGPVSRCTKDGAFSLTGTHWRVGNKVVSGDELLARAERV